MALPCVLINSCINSNAWVNKFTYVIFILELQVFGGRKLMQF